MRHSPGWVSTGTKDPTSGGPAVRYFQSQRLELYKAHAAELLEKGHAYRCYRTPERLSRLREEQAAAKSGQGYDRHCRSLSDAERREAEASGASSVIRLKVSLEGATTFTDLLLGDITVSNSDINPDPVLIKSDGFPTYHMGNVVDDHLMEITHIMRAQEWLPSAPLHMIIYRAFGWEPPKLCHLPMVMGKDGQKLSKRHGATNVREFRRLGYLPEALLNYIALVGWSYDDSREFFSREELEKLFSLEKINKAPAVFDYQKLEWFNGNYMRKKTADEMASLIKPVIKEAGFTADSEMLRRIAPLIQERVKLLSEVPDMVRFLFEDPAPPAPEALIPKKADAAKALAALRRADVLLGELSDLGEEAETRFRALADELGMKLGDLLMPVRIAVTDAKVSPPLFGSIAAMGVDRARARMARAISVLAEMREGVEGMAEKSDVRAEPVTMDTLVSLTKRRGFIFPSSEIYGGLASAWDYGPMGVELKKRIQEFWWREMTQLHDNIVGLDAAIMMHPRVWEASGHVENFTDPLIDRKNCKHRFRADQIPEENLKTHTCPDCGATQLTEARKFNLMFTTHMGPVEDEGGVIYLRPETAQGIYVNYKNVLQTGRVKVPFGIAQVGKAFRNEITTKNFIFRTCEFEQMEMQFFIHPSEDARWFEHWKGKRLQFYIDLGIRPGKLRFHQHGPGELAHSPKLAFDIQYEFPFGAEGAGRYPQPPDHDFFEAPHRVRGKGPVVPERGDPWSATSPTSSKPQPARPGPCSSPWRTPTTKRSWKERKGSSCASIPASPPPPSGSSRS